MFARNGVTKFAGTAIVAGALDWQPSPPQAPPQRSVRLTTTS